MQRFVSPSIVPALLLLHVLIGQVLLADEPQKPAEPVAYAATDWPWWRGIQRNGIAAADQTPPLEWSETKNVVWKAPVPGRGHGSPTVIGDQVFLATADKEVQSVLCYDRRTGKQLWQTEVHRGSFEPKGSNAKSSLASSTAACDGTRVFINFLHKGAIYTSALDRQGKILWQTKVSDYVLHQGFGSSPTVYESLVLVTADNKGGGAIAGLDRAGGKIVWRQERPALPNYASPMVLSVAGKDQLVMTGCDLVASFNPRDGKKLWEIKGSTTECVTSTVTDGKHIFTSGGYPTPHVSAVRADGSGKVVWQNGSKVYVPSMLVFKDHLYGVQDAGSAVCWHCETGKEVWKGRLDGAFSASPVLVGEHIFATSETGRTFIYKCTPAGLNVIAENQLGQEVMASPAICGSRIYLRVAVRGKEERQEMLYCLGAK